MTSSDLDARRSVAARAWPGLLVAVAVGVVATVLGRWVPLVGGPVLAILFGAALGAMVPTLHERYWRPGYDVAAGPVLKASVVVLGTGLSLRQVVEVGGSSLPVLLGTLAIALLAAWLLGPRLGVSRDATTLIGVGTAICGASAIAAASSVLRPRNADVAYALGTIFAFNVAAVLAFPPLGHLLGMDGEAFGLWAGTAINDTSSVVAAAYSYGDGAGPHAVVVKLTRALMIVPIVLALVVIRSRRGASEGAPTPWRRIFPVFIVGFLVAAALNSVGAIPEGWHVGLSDLGVLLIAVALAGIGLGLPPAELREAGVRPIVLGGVLWVLVATSSLALQAVTGTL